MVRDFNVLCSVLLTLNLKRRLRYTVNRFNLFLLRRSGVQVRGKRFIADARVNKGDLLAKYVNYFLNINSEKHPTGRKQTFRDHRLSLQSYEQHGVL